MSAVHLSDEQCRRCYIEACGIDAMIQPQVSAWPAGDGGLRFLSPNHQEVVITRTDRTLAVDALTTKIKGQLK